MLAKVSNSQLAAGSMLSGSHVDYPLSQLVASYKKFNQQVCIPLLDLTGYS